MPSAGEILNGLSTTADSWQPIAVAWHVYFAALAAAFLLAWRPSKWLVAALLIPPHVSVSVMAWIEGNPFNGAVFALLSAVLVLVLRSLSDTPVKMASGSWLAVGALLFGFAWVYPHFLDSDSALIYLYAAPLGLVPCPTLSMAVAATILCQGLGSRIWSLALLIAGLFYGVFGSLYLGVTIDWVLAGGASGLLILLVLQRVPDDAGAA
jgi:hypothetical protein